MAQKKFINPEGMVRPGAYTPVVTAQGGRTIYIAGQVSLDEKGEIVGKGDLMAQAEQVWRNVGLALKGAGATFNDLVKINVYVVDYKPEYRDLLHKMRLRHVSKENPPVSTLIGVQALARDAFLIEIDAIAVAD